jgi:hypothetical protein
MVADCQSGRHQGGIRPAAYFVPDSIGLPSSRRPSAVTTTDSARASAINATLHEKLNFNVIRNLTPVAGISRVPFVMEGESIGSGEDGFRIHRLTDQAIILDCCDAHSTSEMGQGRRSGTAQMRFRSISASRPSGGGG